MALSVLEVVLVPSEQAIAKALGSYRQLKSEEAGLKDVHGFKGDGASIHTEGAGGELAFAKAFDLYPIFSEGTFKAPDFSTNIQIRTRSSHSYELIVRKDDSPTDIFVLITGTMPTYRIRGWMYGVEAMKPQYLENHGGREPAYFPPNSSLHDLRELDFTERKKPVFPVVVAVKDDYPF